MLSAGVDGTVRLWDMIGLREIAVFRHHDQQVYAAAFLPDGQSALSAGRGGILSVWTLADGKVRRAIRAHETIAWGLAASPDGRFAVTVGNDIEEAARDEDPMVRSAVAEAFGALGDPRRAKALDRLLGDRIPEVRKEALRAASRLGLRLPLAKLAAFLEDGAPQVRLEAARAMGIRAGLLWPKGQAGVDSALAWHRKPP